VRRVPPPAADCQPYERGPCLFPFPDNRFTRPDATSATGVRVSLPAGAMPVNRSGERMSVGEYDRGDGFSPGSTMIVHVPGLDNARAFAATAPAGLLDVSASYSPKQPVVIVDEQTARRQLLFSELDARATSRQTTDLLIHPAGNLLEGHTYVVALRDLRDSRGRPLAAPEWFERLRDGRRLPAAERVQRARYARILAVLRRAGVTARGLYEAWDFTVASTAGLTSRLLAIRNAAFAQLGDFDLGDGRAQGGPPSFTITSSDAIGAQMRRVQGTFTVPCYLTSCGPTASGGFHYESPLPDATPAQLPGNVASAEFDCIVPASATPGRPARIALYGHGFLSSHAEVEAAWVQDLASEYNIAFCATDWWGLAGPDLPNLVDALRDVDLLPGIADRVQQGVLNALYLGRLMLSPHGLGSDPAFQLGGRPVIDTSQVYYDGNSVGGMLGGVLAAVSPDVRRAVLGVTGIDLFTVMVPRGINFSDFGEFALRNYRDRSLRPLVLDLLQQIFDRADPGAYAQQMTVDPLPGTPPHTVLMQIAYGDFQVSMYAAAAEARAVGASAHEPALDETADRARDAHPLDGVPAIGSNPFAGSAIVMWDSGPGHTHPPPLADVPPIAGDPASQDPHEDPRYTPTAQLQISDFLAPAGSVVDVCGGLPCHTSTYMP
jgi:hypothetical protein